MSEIRKYMPSNGIEGYSFIERWCENCKREEWLQGNEDGEKCPILTASFLDKNGQDEWQWNTETGDAWCTAFEAREEE